MADLRYPIPAELAAMDPARHQVIEASAGTGKTFLIEHRVVDLLLTTSATIDQILVVTFTEKATSELRGRVRRLLEQVVTADPEPVPLADGAPCWRIDGSARDRLGDALLGFDRAAIHTIHGFCHRVLSEHAFANRRLFVQTQVAGETAFAAAFKALLRGRLARDPADASFLAAWLRSGSTVDDLQRLLYRCAEKHAAIVPPFDVVGLTARLVAANDAALACDDDSFERELRRRGTHHSTAAALRRRVDKLRPLLEGFAAHGDLPGFLIAAALPAVDCDYLLRLEAIELEATGPAALAAALIELARGLVPFEAAIVQRYLPAIRARVHQDKDRHGWFDFHDMLRLVRDGLAGPDGDGMAAALRARYRYALIDEFQDTDELQWQIFRRLYLEGEPENRLTIVGDPKQAIYGFRGADVHTYLAARAELLAAGAQETVLAANYRSTPDLVAALNHLFAGADGGTLFTGAIGYGEPIIAARELVLRRADAAAIGDPGEPVVPVQLVSVVPSGDELTADVLRASHAAFIADEIAALLGDPARSLTIGPPDRPRVVTAGDIFVLTRSLGESEQIAGALRAAGVACALYKQEGLFQSAEASEVRDLLAGIAEPRRRSARFAAWQTRFFGLGLADLLALGDLAETHPLVARLYEWKALADRLEYEQLFTRIISDSGVVERELFTRPGERGLTNFLHLFELLLEEIMRSRCELAELTRRLEHWIDHLVDSTADQRNVQRLESDRAAVQIMTIHKAKGLEARLVFLHGFAAPPSDILGTLHRDQTRILQVGRPDPATRAAIEAESAEEDQRLLYVAVTRAVARLYLPYVDPDHYRRKLGSYHQLNQRLAAIVAALEKEEPGGALAARFTRIAVAEQRPGDGRRSRPPNAADHRPLPSGSSRSGPTAAAPPWRPPSHLLCAAVPDPERARLRQDRRGFEITSYTRLAPRAAAPPIDPRDFKADYDNGAVRTGADQLPGGAQTGIFLHELLEQVPLPSLTETPDFAAWQKRPDIAALFADGLRRHDRNPRHLGHAQQLVFTALTAPIEIPGARFSGLAQCPRTAREVEFLYPLAPRDATAAGDFVRGFIDLLVAAEDRIYLVDWKSDLLASYHPDPLAEHVTRHYLLQARLYATAVTRMLGIDDRAGYDAGFGGALFCFLRAMDSAQPGRGVVRVRPDFDDLEGLAWAGVGSAVAGPLPTATGGRPRREGA